MATLRDILGKITEIQKMSVLKLDKHEQQIVSAFSKISNLSPVEGQDSFLNLFLDEIDGNTSTDYIALNELLDNIIG